RLIDANAAIQHHQQKIQNIGKLAADLALASFTAQFEENGKTAIDEKSEEEAERRIARTHRAVSQKRGKQNRGGGRQGRDQAQGGKEKHRVRKEKPRPQQQVPRLPDRAGAG